MTSVEIKLKRNYKQPNSEHLANQVRRLYRMTLAEWQAEIAKPCEICKEAEKRRVLDHNHITMQVRGTLCYSCNVKVGRLESGKRNRKGLQWNPMPYLAYLERYDGRTKNHV